LSNQLHRFDDDDISGRTPVMNRIESIQLQWKNVQAEISDFDKNGRIKQEIETKVIPVDSAILKLSLAEINPNISKLKKKIENDPYSKRVDRWKEQLFKLELQKQEIHNKLKQYAST